MEAFPCPLLKIQQSDNNRVVVVVVFKKKKERRINLRGQRKCHWKYQGMRDAIQFPRRDP